MDVIFRQALDPAEKGPHKYILAWKIGTIRLLVRNIVDNNYRVRRCEIHEYYLLVRLVDYI